MKTNKTELVFLVDRSGSMSTIRKDMEGALSKLIEDQKTLNSECVVTYYQFDCNGYNLNLNGTFVENILDKVYEAKPIKEVGSIVIDPRGGTPLHDAICLSMDEVGKRLALTKEEDRPERVLFFVISDGEENSSRTFSGKDVKKRVDHQSNVYKWKIEFLGCNFDAVSVGTSIGINFGSTMTFNHSTIGIRNAIGSLSSKIMSYRSMDSTTYCNSNIDYTEDERKQAGQ
jgi:hypothetical protein